MERQTLQEVLQERDGMSKEESSNLVSQLGDDINSILDMAYTSDVYDQIEDYLMDEVGLEMDYLFDIL